MEKVSIICLIINFLAIGIILIFKNHLPPVIPLFYGLPVSNGELSPTLGLTIPPIAASISIIINYIISRLAKDKFLNEIFFGLSITLTALAIITVVKIFLLVGTFS